MESQLDGLIVDSTLLPAATQKMLAKELEVCLLVVVIRVALGLLHYFQQAEQQLSGYCVWLLNREGCSGLRCTVRCFNQSAYP
jgi:hypothetical protein